MQINLLFQNPFFLFLLLLLIIIVLQGIHQFHLKKQLLILSNELLSFKRHSEVRETQMLNVTSCLTAATPIHMNSAIKEQEFLNKIQNLINNTSIKINKSIQSNFTNDRELWDKKFSILLKTLGKTEQDLIEQRDQSFKHTWESISELNQKAQLLFQDMKEDGIFYRTQSLWLLGELSYTKTHFAEAWRYFIAAVKLYKNSQPELPLTISTLWKIGYTLSECAKELDNESQFDILNKFQISKKEIVSLYENINQSSPNPEVLQRIRIWNNNLR